MTISQDPFPSSFLHNAKVLCRLILTNVQIPWFPYSLMLCYVLVQSVYLEVKLLLRLAWRRLRQKVEIECINASVPRVW